MKVPKLDAGFDFDTKRAPEDQEKERLLNVISDCFSNKNPVPEWAQKALIGAVAKANTYQIKSWDEVFGRPLKKGKQLIVQRRRLALIEPIFKRVQERKKAGESITKDLFESVGEEFDLSGTLVSDLYYEVQAIIDEAEIFNSARKSIE